MGKPTRNEILAEYYLRAAGVAAVWIDAEGHDGGQDVVPIGIKSDRLVYCCERGAHFILAYRLYEWNKAVEVSDGAVTPQKQDIATVIAELEDLADRSGVGLTPHAVAVDRALAAVAKVNETLAGSTGDIQQLNAAFKKARKADPSIKYADYLDARKAAMLETLARGVLG